MCPCSPHRMWICWSASDTFDKLKCCFVTQPTQSNHFYVPKMYITHLVWRRRGMKNDYHGLPYISKSSDIILFLLLPLNWSNLAFSPKHYCAEINGHVGHIDTSAEDPINRGNFSVCVCLCVTVQIKWNLCGLICIFFSWLWCWNHRRPECES